MKFRRFPYRLHRSTIFRKIALVLALTYAAFRTEPFEKEYEYSHPADAAGASVPAIGLPTLTWETFDKDNAPKAFVFTLLTMFFVLMLSLNVVPFFRVIPAPFRILRDKSPPVLPAVDVR